MGVSGTGKSTVGVALADRLGAAWVDGDDLHPPANVAKMAAGVPLDDADRAPWLDRVGAWLAEHGSAAGGVVACSALRRAYRDRLRAAAPTTFHVHLDGPVEVVAARQAGRPGHFMPASLLASQLALLEPLAPDEAGVVLDVRRGVEELVEQACAAVRQHGRRAPVGDGPDGPA